MDKFIGYIGPPSIHDSVILSIHQEVDIVRIILKAYEGHLILVEFQGVEFIRQHLAEGMVLYALSEMQTALPLRHFVFVDTRAGEDGAEAFLEVFARDLSSSEIAASE
jgi:hypothetical protein